MLEPFFGRKKAFPDNASLFSLRTLHNRLQASQYLLGSDKRRIVIIVRRLGIGEYYFFDALNLREEFPRNPRKSFGGILAKSLWSQNCDIFN